MNNLRTRILLLDLEETMIPVWGTFIVPPAYADVIQRVAVNFQPQRTEIFSWAIYNQADLDVFSREQDSLECEVGLRFDHVHDIDSLIKQYNATTRIQVSDHCDFFDFISKERFLFDMANKGAFKDQHLLLLDDAVSSFIFKKADTNTVIEVVNTSDNLSSVGKLRD